MSEINIGQFIKNAFDYSTGKQPTQQPTKVANEQFQQAQNELAKQINQTVQNIARNFVQQQDILTAQMQLKELSNLEKTMLLKNLFDFPSNIKDIAVFLAKENVVASAKELQLLMSQPIDITNLIVLMQKNGKIASDKIEKMIATMNQSGAFNTRQLKEMSALINACIPAPDTPPAQVLKDFMLMYLPWLPLNEGAEFNLGSESSEDKKSSAGDESITIIFSTKNYGIIKIFLFKDEGSFCIDLNCNENFPKNVFNEQIATISQNACVNVNKNVTFTTRKASQEDKKEKTNVEFSKTQKVTPELLILIHTVIKIIIEIDNQSVA